MFPHGPAQPGGGCTQDPLPLCLRMVIGALGAGAQPCSSWLCPTPRPPPSGPDFVLT